MIETRAHAIDKLKDAPPQDRLVGWLVTLAITAFAFAIRWVDLRRPGNLVFDETYYPKDAWTMLHLGYEGTWPETQPGTKTKINDAIAQGITNGWTPEPSFVVHPPLGKWLIALGEHFYGMNSFGWRVSSLVAGTLLVMATIRLARRLSRSTLVGGIAGLLLALDGLAFTMSRIGLLDIFQALFLVCGVACVAADRDWFRHRLAAYLEHAGWADLGGSFGPGLVLRPWRIAAGVCFGLACAVKWNSMFVLAAMGILSVVWDLGARRLAGAGHRSLLSLLRDGIPAFVQLVVVAVPVYLASWTGWLVTHGGWSRDWGAKNPDAWTTRFLGKPLASLWHYHQEIYNFHTGDSMMNATHVYEANPWGWLVMARPIGIDAVNDIKPGVDGCQAVNDTCLRVISGAGTPVLWWMALAALLAGLVVWIAGRDWRFGLPIVAAMSTYLPWFNYDDRPLFFFYAICIIPFTVTVLALWLGKLLGPADGPDRRRRALLVGGAVALVAANFCFIYPVLTDQMMTRKAWLARMWFRSWI
ncbi:dolichyl-phosphate-mannose--protein mannosyltransferase [Luteococcus peritonei]|uniref:Polyprenol-phosphate-mannose--protein mannosyltransferase n=1 Tax=Luteococcus peritonei TaxID=88874 RepID=A0ABW4RZV3_9ACTN